jgi:hypothetical protein
MCRAAVDFRNVSVRWTVSQLASIVRFDASYRVGRSMKTRKSRKVERQWFATLAQSHYLETEAVSLTRGEWI